MRNTALVLAFILALLCGAVRLHTVSANAVTAEEITLMPNEIAERGFGASEEITISSTVKNDSDQSRNATLIAAFFKAGNLLQTNLETQEIPGNSERIISKTIKSPAKTEGVDMKVMVWDTNSLYPALNKTFALLPREPFYVVDDQAVAKYENLPTGQLIAATTGGYAELTRDGASYMSINIVDGGEMPFDSALSVATIAETPNATSAQLRLKNNNAINQGDMLLISFFIRSISSNAESGEAATEIALELNRDPFTKLILTSPPMRKSWQQVFIPIEAKQDFAAGETQISIRAGYGIQTFEFADLKLENYGASVDFSDLPYTVVKYDGYDYDPTTPWRIEAEKRIEQHRKGDLTVTVKNQAGQPISNAAVEVEMLEHDFMWGTAVGSKYILGTDADSETYRQRTLECFNTAVMEYEMKWKSFEENNQRAIDLYNWLGSNGLKLRGHTLVWDRQSQLPEDIPDLLAQPQQLKQRINTHVSSLAGLFSGRLQHWDVLNEPILNTYMTESVGSDQWTQWFKLAKEADPHAKLYVNETQIAGRPTATVNQIKAIVQQMLEAGAPVEGIGVQGHFNGSACNPMDFYKQLDELAKTGLDLAITEYDIDTNDEQLQANFIRDIMTVSFSHPKVTAFLMWGFWDGYHWKNNAPLYRKDWSLKPSGAQYIDLVYDKWWTNESGNTGDDGRLCVRGFYGTYKISVTVDGKTTHSYYQLSPDTTGEVTATLTGGELSFSPAPYQPPTFSALGGTAYE